jgi:hypothetical protein
LPAKLTTPQTVRNFNTVFRILTTEKARLVTYEIEDWVPVIYDARQ